MKRPKLPEIITHLVCNGTYAIYAVSGEDFPLLLRTNRGELFKVDGVGRILSPCERALTDFTIEDVVRLEADLLGPVIRIDN